MKCPVCKEPELVMSERQGIEIDYCPSCRGVWLDRGELDKLLEKAVSGMANTQSAQPQRSQQPHYPSQPQHYDNRSGYYKKQKSWLSEIFD